MEELSQGRILSEEGPEGRIGIGISRKYYQRPVFFFVAYLDLLLWFLTAMIFPNYAICHATVSQTKPPKSYYDSYDFTHLLLYNSESFKILFQTAPLILYWPEILKNGGIAALTAVVLNMQSTFSSHIRFGMHCTL